jgi:predicted nuclease of restriction endonuclease-like RecB superfamily
VKSYGRPLPKSIEERQSLVWELCSLYINEYKNSIKGLVSVRNNAEKVHKISAHINNELREFLFEQFSSSLSEPLKDTKIQMALRKFDTINQLGFPSMNSFLFLITPLLNALKHPM